ncbi:hypothetical protein [Kyrpidia tusciae]|uniref:Uncharacterized protein n=1 Tax=Kyrpidia tusciae (strain DSM 2912 / NBRC 15312 / T2) TaxID=562970 RepID=D5WTW1_KYRT2|nr:hypothetical protein [Kyrpidia tusciae]ADG05281.1 hypothetical protein Btus_0513 [Kyrpidia tusciae DSM 2912]
MMNKLYGLFGATLGVAFVAFCLSAYFLSQQMYGAIGWTVLVALVLYIIFGLTADRVDFRRDGRYRTNNLNFGYYKHHSTPAAVRRLEEEKAHKDQRSQAS